MEWIKIFVTSFEGNGEFQTFFEFIVKWIKKIFISLWRGVFFFDDCGGFGKSCTMYYKGLMM